MGNSEVGHLNLGAGAVIKQDLTRIDEAVADGGCATTPCWATRCARRARAPDRPGQRRRSALGLEHLEALIDLAAEQGVADLVVHAFTDGRDTSPHGGARFVAEVEDWCARRGVGRVGSVIGRYYAMDRDQRWERTQQAYDLLVARRGAAPRRRAGDDAVRAAYERGETDEFITATTVGDEARDPPRRLGHRASTSAPTACADHAGWPIGFASPRRRCAVARYTTLTEYEEGWPCRSRSRRRGPRSTLSHIDRRGGRRASCTSRRPRSTRM